MSAFVLIPDLGLLLIDGVCFKALGASVGAQASLKQTPTKICLGVKPLEPRTDMNNAVVIQSFLAPAYYKDPAEQLLSPADPLPPSIRPGFLHSSAKVWKIKMDHFQALKCLRKYQKVWERYKWHKTFRFSYFKKEASLIFNGAHCWV